MGINITETLRSRICCIIKQPKRDITYAWVVSLVLVFIAFIVACVSSAKLAKSGGAGHAASFSAMWTALLLVVISVVGTIIMRKYQTALAIGFLLGIIFVMTQQMLIIFAIFTERSKLPNETMTVVQSQQAMAVFSFFLFIVYFAFGSMLAVFRNDIIKEELPMDDHDAESSQQQQQQQYTNNPSANAGGSGNASQYEETI